MEVTIVRSDLAVFWISRKCEYGSCYIVGAEQAQHFAMVFEVAEMPDSWMKVNAIRLPFGLVMGTDGKKLASRTVERIPSE